MKKNRAAQALNKLRNQKYGADWLKENAKKARAAGVAKRKRRA